MFTRFLPPKPIPQDDRRFCPGCHKPVPYHGFILCPDCR